MEEKKITHQESLDIIVQMINHAQVNVKQSSFHLLLWGWLIALASFTHYFLLQTDFQNPQMAWIIMIPGALISMIYGFVQGKKAKVQTYADRLYFLTWMGFLISIVLLQVFFYEYPTVIGISILVLTGNTVFISGLILKFKPLLIGGIVFWVASIVGHFSGGDSILLITGMAVICGYLVPGYLLKNKADEGI